MDRVIIYPGQVPLETDLLQTNKFAMVALSKLAAAVLGTATLANGFSVVPTGPASLSVNVNPGEIYSLQNIDSTAYSSIAADTTHSIVKQGISLDVKNLVCAAPGTVGQSINYLIQATYTDSDSGSIVLPYYNASNPAVAYSGPGGTGIAQNTLRQGVVTLQAKAGISATSGSQVTPAPDAGYIGLYVVTVANGQTTINSGNISLFNGAPLISETLQQKISAATLAVLKGLQSFTSSGSFTVPTGVTKLVVSGSGGGGGGGGSGGANGGASFAASGGGGGGAAGICAIKQTITVTPGQVLTITVGAGGSAGTAGTSGGTAATNGGDGGSTTIIGTGVSLSLTGGAGGKASAYAAGSNVGLTGGAGGLPSGTGGGVGYAVSGYAFNLGGTGGVGGASPFGLPGGGVVPSVAGASGSGFGTGGSGAGGVIGGTINGFAGGAGTPGIVIIEW